MGRDENARVAREMSDAFDRGDMQAADRLIADDVVWHQIGAPDLRGKEALRRMSEPGSTDYEIKGTAHDILASDDHAIALANATATRAGKTFQYRTAEIYHIKDGKVTERWAFSDDTEAIKRFFA
jgi:ketosteroid isomerase-like protein